MKLGLTDKQYNNLLTLISETELEEQAEPPPADPEAGTSSKQSGGQGYPSVGKWESGVTRGPGNQVGVTKWADVVGSKLTRGKANPLKEQEGRQDVLNYVKNDGQQEKVKKENEKRDFDDKFIIVKIPPRNRFNKTSLVIPKSGEHEVWDPNLDRVQVFFKSWEGTENQNKIPENKVFNPLFPDNTLRNFTTENRDFYISKLVFKNGSWEFDWYVNKNDGKPYDENETLKGVKIPNEYISDWYDQWGKIVLPISSVLVFFIFPGWGGIVAATLLDLGVAAIEFSRGDTLGGIINLIAAFLPGVSEYLGWGRCTIEEAKAVSTYVKDIKYSNELPEMFNAMSPTYIKNDRHRYLLQKLVSENPKVIKEAIDKVIVNGVKIASKDKSKMLRLMLNLNYMFKNKLISKQSAKSIFDTLAAREMGYFFTAYGVIHIGVKLGSWAYEQMVNRGYDKIVENKFEEITDNPGLINTIESDPAFDLGPQITKIYEMGLITQYDSKINPVLDIYQKKYQETNPKYYVKISGYLLNEFIKNQNQDFKKLATDFDLKRK